MIEVGNKQEINTANYGEMVLAMVPMPADSNPRGNVFGGWLLAQLDVAGAVVARRLAPRIVTKAVNKVDFIAPVYIGDKVDFFAKIIHQGKTSIVTTITVLAERYDGSGVVLVSTAEFVYVRLSETGAKLESA